MKVLVSVLLPGLLLFAGSLFAQTSKDVEATRAEMEADRMEIVSLNLDLTNEEEGAFWGVYRDYRRDLNKLGDRGADLIGEYAANWGSVSDELAARLVRDYLDVQIERGKVKQDYVEKFSKVLPPKKVMRFYQIENKLEAVVQYELADSIPLVEEGN